MRGLLHDLRSSARSLRRRPVYAAVSVSVLAVGLAASTALVTYVNAFYQPLPGVADAGHLVRISSLGEDGSARGLSYPDSIDYAARQQTLTGLAGTGLFAGSLRDGRGEGGTTHWIWGRLVSGNFFTLLNVEMAVGRGFTAADDRPEAGAVCVLSYRFWRRNFDSDETVVGRVVYLDGRAITVKGVTAPRFRTVYAGFQPDLWLPISQLQVLRPEAWKARYSRRDRPSFGYLGRLRPGVSTAEAQAELQVIASRLDRAYPQTEKRRIHVTPARRFVQRAIDNHLPEAWGMLAAAGVLLVLACANAANVLLSVALGRSRELAVRAALGAEPRQLRRLILIENLVVALAAGALSLALAGPLGAWLMTYAEPPAVFGFANAPDVILDVRVCAAAITLALAAGLASGLLPTWSASRRDLVTSLKDTGDRASGWRRLSVRDLMVSIQVALSVVLLVLAGLLLRTLDNARHQGAGFDTENLLAATLSTRSRQLSPEASMRFFQELAARVADAPGVREASVTRQVPLAEVTRWETLAAVGRDEPVTAAMAAVGPRYVETLGLELRHGRGLDERDTAAAPGAVMVNETLARRLFPGAAATALSRRLKLPDSEDAETFEIVGVVADTRFVDLLAPDPEPVVYFSCFQHGAAPTGALMVRTETDPAAVIPALRRQLRSLDPDLALVNVLTMAEIVRGTRFEQRMKAELFSLLALFGLALATAGVWSVLDLAVRRRGREMGIRMALGARRGDVAGLVIWRGLVAVSLGLGVGLLASMAAARWVRGLLYGVETTDPIAFGVGAGVLLLAAVVACYLPARRAATVDPLTSLRCE